MLRGWYSGFSILLIVVTTVCGAEVDRKAPLEHEVYVWQRSWNSRVVEAVQREATNFTTLVVLNAEINWRNGSPDATRVALNYPSLVASQREIGLVLRIGSFSGPFSATDDRG